MVKDEFFKVLARPCGKKQVIQLADLCVNELNFTTDLLDLTFYKDRTIAFKAAWILEHVFERHPKELSHHLLDFIKRYPNQYHDSCKRHFTKIMMAITSQKEVHESLLKFNWESIIECTFIWLTNSACPVAVQVNCCDILYNLKDVDSWIAEELKFQLDYLLKDGSAALQSRGKRLLIKLKSN